MTAGRDPSDVPPRAWRITVYAHDQAVQVEVVPTEEEALEWAAMWNFATEQRSGWSVAIEPVP